ncbi:dUTPase [Clostridium tertium]|uniref:dUTPase n=1 Tax=Clostridium tertium TaxID=1559 RepID=A0A6N3GLR3_9CLOT
MNIKAFFEAQRERNSKIIIDESLSEYKISARKHLELHTKLSHLAANTKCYKYWIDEDINFDKDSTFLRYIDCFSNIISIGIDKGYDNVIEVPIKPNDYCLSDQFLNLFIDLNDLIISPSEDHYITLLEDFISLGITLGYSDSKISNGFINM